jgi:replicative superfamily II helicase
VLISKGYDPLAKEKIPIQIYYVTTNKSLVNDKYRDWNEKFSYLNISCGKESNANINLMTARQWYKLMLKSRQNTLDNADLLLVDEIHQIEDSFQGYLFEVGISYSKVYTELKFRNAIDDANETNLKNCRIIAMSATIPNVKQFSEWLNADNFVFDDSYRSSKLKSVFCELEDTISSADQFFAQFKQLSKDKLREILKKHNPKFLPTLIFVPSNNKVKECCINVKEWIPNEVLNEDDNSILKKITNCINDSSLRESIFTKRVAFHTSDLSVNDQNIVEDLMKKGCLRIVFSTTTLAVGTNFPIFMSIVCTTAKYENKKLENNLETYKIEQMLGRACRKGHELETGYSFNFGIGAIMSSNTKYKNTEKVQIESALYKSVQLKSFQIEHIIFDIMAQIVTITDTCLTKILQTTFCQSYKNYCLSHAIEKLVEKKLIKKIKDSSLPQSNDNESLFTTTALTKFFEKECIGYENIIIILNDLNNVKDVVIKNARDKPFQYITTNGHGSFIAQVD